MASLKELYEQKNSDNSWMGSIVEKKERDFTEGEKTHMESPTIPRTDKNKNSQLDLYNEGTLNIEKYVENTPEGVGV